MSSESVPVTIRNPRNLLFVYALLVFGWQAIGLALNAAGLPALGPTASGAVAGAALVFAALFAWTANRLPSGLVLLSLLSALGAGLTLYNTFRPGVDLSLWPSPAARYAGALINVIGVIGFPAAVVGYARWRSGNAK